MRENHIYRKHVLLAFILLVALTSCSTRYYYIKGLKDAQNPTPADVFNGLTPVSTSNKSLQFTTINGKQYVLTATWAPDTTYYTKNYDSSLGYYVYNSGTHRTWITLSPQLKDMGLGGLSDKKLNTRIQQLLGLPPTSKYTYFIEIWVTPEDLQRPCFSPIVDTNVCEFKPSKDDQKRAEYLCWLYQYIYDSYSDPDMMNRYPFTHLGYTYDWSPKNKSHVGLSEFVIGDNKKVYIKKISTTRQYIGN